VYEGEQEGPQNVVRLLIGRAVAHIYKRYFPDPTDKEKGRAAYQPILSWFAKGNAVDVSPDMPFEGYARALDAVEGLRDVVVSHTRPSTPAETASAMEFVLEALHQQSLLGKDRVEEKAHYSDLMGSVLGAIGRLEDEDDDEEDWNDYRRLG